MIKEVLYDDEVLFLEGNTGLVGLAKFKSEGHIFIGTPNLEEISIFMNPDDLIAVSAFKTGKEFKKGIKSMIYLLRDMGAPLIVLPEDHPSSKRLPLVVSCGDHIRLDCNITPGTHPEQDILCACNDLSGVEIFATSNGVELHGHPLNLVKEKL
jgi:hypothetical protein